MTSSYIYRGLSFSNDHPALQGSFYWGYGNIFAGAWSSSLSDQDGDGYELETDYYAGYANSFAGIDWFVVPIYYKFSSFDQNNTAGADADIFEVWLDASYAINETFSINSMYAYSPDFFFESGDAHYIKGDITVNLPAGFSLNARIGYQVEGDNVDFVGADGWDYTHWDVSLAKSVVGFDLSLMYNDTSADKITDSVNANFFDSTDNSDDTVMFKV